MDYEDLFLYSNALTEEVASPAHGPSECRNPSFYPTATPEEVCDRELAPLTWDRQEQRWPTAARGDFLERKTIELSIAPTIETSRDFAGPFN